MKPLEIVDKILKDYDEEVIMNSLDDIYYKFQQNTGELHFVGESLELNALAEAGQGIGLNDYFTLENKLEVYRELLNKLGE